MKNKKNWTLLDHARNTYVNEDGEDPIAQIVEMSNNVRIHKTLREIQNWLLNNTVFLSMALSIPKKDIQSAIKYWTDNA
jgi:hypothetical protein